MKFILLVVVSVIGGNAVSMNPNQNRSSNMSVLCAIDRGSGNAAAIPLAVKNLVGSSYSPKHIDCVGCYGNGGMAANAGRAVNGQLPRCHSEFFLFKAIQNAANGNTASLNGCRIKIQNTRYKPCVTPAGTNGVTNPGITCDELLNSCSQPNGHFCGCFGFYCSQIVVLFPGGLGLEEYPKQ